MSTAKYRAEHKEQARAWQIKYRAEHAEQIKATWSRYYALNRNRLRANSAKYTKDHPEWKKQYDAYRRKTYRDVTSRQRVAKRKAIKLGAAVGDPHSIAIWIKFWRKKKSVKCYWCGGKVPSKECHADHIIPLSKGGMHALSNLAIACGNCNNRKHTKLPNDWNLSLEQPRLFF